MCLFILVKTTEDVLHLDNSNKIGVFKDIANKIGVLKDFAIVEKIIMNMILKEGETNLRI